MSSSNLLRGWEPLQVSKEVIKESRDANSGKILLKGILQRANALNQNGRIYPKNLLQREINNYQKFINESRALGECVPKGTKILAESGWKNIEDVVLGERVATLNTETNEIEYQETLGIVNKDYSGELIRFKNHSTIDFSVTPDHKVLYWDRKGKAKYCSASYAETLHEMKDSAFSHSSFKRSGKWVGDDSEYITIPNTTRKFRTDDWAAFLGIYLAEGFVNGTRGAKRGSSIHICQVKEESRKLIFDLLNKMEFNQIKVEDRSFVLVGEKELEEHLFQFGNSYQKFIPDYAKNWSVKKL